MIGRFKHILIKSFALPLLALFLSACGAVESQPQDEEGIEQSAGSLALTDVPVVPTLLTGGLPDPTMNSSDDGPELGFALGDPNLKATDPSTVVLASGQIQLIEFFAFW